MQVVVHSTLINYTDTGKGPVLVCLHGWMDSLVTYKALGVELKDSYRIIALDLPNFGGSEVTDKILSLDDYALFLEAFVKKLSIDDYTLVGHSLGGQISMYAIGNGTVSPDRLVLLDAAGIRNHHKFSKTILKILSKPLRLIMPSKLKVKLYRLIGSDYNPDLSEIHKKLIKRALSHDVQDMATKITIPTLLIYGSKDTSTPPWMGRKLASLIKGSKFELVDGEAHWPHQTAAAKVANSMKAFLNS